jgi:Fe-S-cluster-containing dehydrogenase component
MDGNMKHWNLVIDVARCEECNNCFLSCKDEFVDNDFLPYSVAQPRHGHRWVDILTKERGQFPQIDVANLPVSCMHCGSAPCVKAGKGAVVQRDDGIVLIDPVKAEGNKELVQACPYGAIFWNEERRLAQKCTLCAHLLDEGWKEPRCVQACPTGARRIHKAEDDEMERRIREENLEAFHPEYSTQPRVYYKNMYRYSKCFIAGDVAFKKNGLIECAGGARVTLSKGPQNISEAVTDNYGDFKFDGLEEQSGSYTLEIVFVGCPTRIVEVDLTTSKNVATIMLNP